MFELTLSSNLSLSSSAKCCSTFPNLLNSLESSRNLFSQAASKMFRGRSFFGIATAPLPPSSATYSSHSFRTTSAAAGAYGSFHRVISLCDLSSRTYFILLPACFSSQSVCGVAPPAIHILRYGYRGSLSCNNPLPLAHYFAQKLFFRRRHLSSIHVWHHQFR